MAASPPPPPRREALALGALTVAAFLLRAVDLTRFELWVDEAATWWFGRLTASGRLLEQIALEPTPPLYYGLIGGLMRLFGESDAVMRWPSVVFGALAVPLVWLAARTLVAGEIGRRASWIAAIWLTIHPLHVAYSREARVYPLLLVLTLALWILLWRALERDRTRDWVLVGVALLAACYSHLFGLFLGAAVGLAVVVFARTTAARLRGLMAAALAGLLFAPYLLLTLPQLRTSGAAWSVAALYRQFPGEKRIGRSLETQLVGAGYTAPMRQLDAPPTPTALRLLSVAAQATLLLLGLGLALRTAERRAILFLAIGWLVPLLVPWLINRWMLREGRAFYQPGRHDVYLLGFTAILLGLGAARLWSSGAMRRALLAVLLILVTAGAAHRLLALHRATPPSLHRAAGEHVADHAGPGDLVVAMGIRRLVTEHYARLAGSEVPFVSFPASTDDHPGWSDTPTLLKNEQALFDEGRAVAAGWSRELPSGATLFVLLRPYQRTANAASETWLVDRHLLEHLRRAGWRPVPELESPAARTAAFRLEIRTERDQDAD